MKNLDITINVRISKEILKSINKELRSNRYVYENVSHFVRVAIVREIARKNKKRFY